MENVQPGDDMVQVERLRLLVRAMNVGLYNISLLPVYVVRQTFFCTSLNLPREQASVVVLWCGNRA